MSRRPPQRRSGAPPGAVVKLTQAEAAVVARAARGLSNREIATALRKSPATVKGQLSTVYRKLRIPGRVQLILMFHR